ncbi:MAG: hypothetical protein LBQ67_01060, partial [Treponema sp.]|nr:hypothetical protein [Treponema sp.]
MTFLPLFVAAMISLGLSACDMLSSSMSDFFLDNTGQAAVTEIRRKTSLFYVGEDGTVLIAPRTPGGVTTFALGLSNPQNFTVRPTVSNSTDAEGTVKARQTGSGEIEIEITGAAEEDEYILTLAMQSSDGLRDFAPYTMRLLFVPPITLYAAIQDFMVDDVMADDLHPPLDPDNIPSTTVKVPYAASTVTLRAAALDDEAVVEIYRTAGASPPAAGILTVEPDGLPAAGTDTVEADGLPAAGIHRVEAEVHLDEGDNCFRLIVTNPEQPAWRQEYPVTIYRGLNPAANEITDFYFTIKGKKYGVGGEVQDNSGSINEGAKTITVTVPPFGVDLTSLIPNIIVSPPASVSPQAGTPGDFSDPEHNPVTYTVTAADGSQQTYTVTVVQGIPGLDQIGSDPELFPLDKDYELTSNMVIDGEWTPIGSSGAPFTGTFDGKGYTVTFDSSATAVGLFGNTDGATIKNLNIVLGDEDNPVATTQENAGGVVGVAKGTTLENITVTGSIVVSRNSAVDGNAWSGLVGRLDGNGGNSRLYRCAVNVDFTAQLLYNEMNGAVGGLLGSAGNNSNITIDECYSTGNVNVTYTSRSYFNTYLFVGGFAGQIKSSATITITNSYASGDVTVVATTHATGYYVGGFIGDVESGGSKTIENCYASGAIIGNVNTGSGDTHRVGGLFGRLGGTARNNAALSPSISATSTSPISIYRVAG